MIEIEALIKLHLLAVLWLALASPLLALLVAVAIRLKRRGVGSRSAGVALGLLAGLLLAPVPTPIITIFVPNGLALIDSSYYVQLVEGGIISQLIPWVVASLAASMLICVPIAMHLLDRGQSDRLQLPTRV